MALKMERLMELNGSDLKSVCFLSIDLTSVNAGNFVFSK